MSELGLGFAAGVPRHDPRRSRRPRRPAGRPVGSEIDRTLSWGRAWHRDKEIVVAEHRADVLAHLRSSDVALVYGPEADVEENGLGYVDVQRSNPQSSTPAAGRAARPRGRSATSVCWSKRSRGSTARWPVTGPVRSSSTRRASASGTAFLMTATVLALLGRREQADRVAGPRPPSTTGCWPRSAPSSAGPNAVPPMSKATGQRVLRSRTSCTAALTAS